MMKFRKRKNNGNITSKKPKAYVDQIEVDKKLERRGLNCNIITRRLNIFGCSNKLFLCFTVMVGSFALWAVQRCLDGMNNASDQKGRDLTPGWGLNSYILYYRKRVEMYGRRDHNIRLAGGNEVTVSEVINNNPSFWGILDGQREWESKTFEIFEKYVTKETIVVDFGTWIGPTLLFHGQISRASYGIEADPSAFAVAERNVWLNKDKDWGRSTSVHPFCVGSTEHAGKIMTMRGVMSPGAGMSGITDTLYKTQKYKKPVGSWTVRCYTLPTILDNWGVVLSRQPVMLKIDTESYECQLVPSLYDWLVVEERDSLPIMYISFHPQIKDCSPEEWLGILKVLQLYDSVFRGGLQMPFLISKETTFEEFEAMKIESLFELDPTFVLVNNLSRSN